MDCKMMLSDNEVVKMNFKWGGSELCITDKNIIYTRDNGSLHQKLPISRVTTIAGYKYEKNG